ncbi:MAG: sensor histidine kinase [Frankia sp.]
MANSPGAPARRTLTRAFAGYLLVLVAAAALGVAGWLTDAADSTVALIGLLMGGGALTLVLAVRVMRGSSRPWAGTNEAVTPAGTGHYDEEASLDGPREVNKVAPVAGRSPVEWMGYQAAQAATTRERADVLRVIEAIRGSLDVDEVLMGAVTVLGEASGADRIVFWPVEGDDVLPVRAEWTAPGVASVRETSRGAPGLARQLPALDRSVLIDDLDRWRGLLPEQIDQFLRRAGAAASLIAQVGDGTNTYGWLSVQSVTARAWGSDIIAVLDASTDELGIALGRARNFEREVAAVARLTELDRERDAFVHAVTHELRTPIGSIAGYVGMLTEPDAEPLPERARSILTVVERNARRLGDLVDEMLTLARVSSADFTVRAEPLTLGPIVDEACTVVAPAAQAGQIRLSRATGGDQAPLLGDPAQLERVVTNLLTNAVKFTPKEGSVSVATKRTDAEVTIEVRDSGIGIPAAEQKDLFTRFFRASTATSNRIPGTGLGLSLVAEIVRGHHGSIELESAEGDGTAVTVRLPLASARVDDSGPAAGS